MGKCKVALVTGASRGIGAATAARLARDGYDVAINYLQREERAMQVLRNVQTQGRRGIAVKADVSDCNQVKHMFECIRSELGEVELLVSNAGISGYTQIQDLTPEQWKRFFEVNVDGAFNTVKCALPHMLSEHRGCIITMSSIWGLRGASCECAYSATKSALIGFSKSLANELAPTGIRVNCIAPGVIDTEMLGGLTEDDIKFLSDRTPVQRLGKPEDIASAVSFLASEEASFITGQVLTCDGGFIV